MHPPLIHRLLPHETTTRPWLQYLLMSEVDFVLLIQNALSVAGKHRDKLWRTRLSLVTPLSDQLVRHTKTPIFGPRGSSTPRNSLGVYQSQGTRYSFRPLAISGANGFKSELALLQEFQNLHYFLLTHKPVPKTQIPKLMNSLSKFPVVSITTLAIDANVSKDTAKRWLKSLELSGRLHVREFNGMKQFAYVKILEILELHVRESSTTH